MQPDFDARSEQLLYRHGKVFELDAIRFQYLGDIICEVVCELIARFQRRQLDPFGPSAYLVRGYVLRAV